MFIEMIIKLTLFEAKLYIFKLRLFHKESTVGQNFKTWSIDSTSPLHKKRGIIINYFDFSKEEVYVHSCTEAKSHYYNNHL